MKFLLLIIFSFINTYILFAQVVVNSPLMINREMKDNQVFEEIITVTNISDSDIFVEYYVNSMLWDNIKRQTTYHDTSLAFSVYDWVVEKSQSFPIRANETMNIPIKINLPENISKGTYSYVVFVKSLTSSSSYHNINNQEVEIRNVVNYGIILYYTFGLPSGDDFSINLDYKNNQLELFIYNNTEFLTAPQILISVYNSAGLLEIQDNNNDLMIRPYAGRTIKKQYNLKPDTYNFIVLLEGLESIMYHKVLVIN